MLLYIVHLPALFPPISFDKTIKICPLFRIQTTFARISSVLIDFSLFFFFTFIYQELFSFPRGLGGLEAVCNCNILLFCEPIVTGFLDPRVIRIYLLLKPSPYPHLYIGFLHAISYTRIFLSFLPRRRIKMERKIINDITYIRLAKDNIIQGRGLVVPCCLYCELK